MQGSAEMARAVKTIESSELAVPIIDVSKLETFDAVARELAEKGANVLDTADLADGYTLLKNKDQLVGSEFIITDHKIRESATYGSTYSVIRLITKATNSRVVITDGSTGIHMQLMDLPEGAYVYCRNGLNRSDYDATADYDPETGMGRPAGTTFYLDTSGGKLPVGTL